MDITLHLTSKCNMNCLYCYNNNKEYQQDMTIAIAQKAVNFAVKQTEIDIIKITFVGGEPLLKKELIHQIVEYCNQHNEKTFLFSILTNGLLLDEEFINFSLKNNIAISLSLDGIKKSHDLYRKIGKKGSWNMINSKFELLISKIPSSMVLITLNPETVIDLTESISYLIEKGTQAISISLNYLAIWHNKHLSLLQTQLLDIAKFYKLCYQENNHFYLNVFDSRMHSLIDGCVNKGRCDPNGNHISIAPDGDFFLCIAFVKKDSYFQIGSIDSGFNANKYKKFQRKRVISNKNCNNCDIKERCFNWCACSNYLATGAINEIPPFLCEFEKMLIQITDKIAEELYSQKNKNFMKRFYYI